MTQPSAINGYQVPFLSNEMKITIAATAGNVIDATSLKPQSGRVYVLRYAYITLVADANPANRYIQINKYDGATENGFGCSSAVVTAGQTRTYGITTEMVSSTSTTETFNSVIRASPFAVISTATNYLRIRIENGLAGDSYSGIFYVYNVGA